MAPAIEVQKPLEIPRRFPLVVVRLREPANAGAVGTTIREGTEHGITNLGFVPSWSMIAFNLNGPHGPRTFLVPMSFVLSMEVA